MSFWLPKLESFTTEYVDKLAVKTRRDEGIGLASFCAAFAHDLTEVLLVQLGDYAKKYYDGNPWTLPGGGVEENELPSKSAIREVKEECDVEIDEARLRFCGWFARPYYKSRRATKQGEIMLLFGCNTNSTILRPKAHPPETLQAAFEPYCFGEWTNVPAKGSGEHRLQPLPRHWLYWAETTKSVLGGTRKPVLWEYADSKAMTRPPWKVD